MTDERVSRALCNARYTMCTRSSRIVCAREASGERTPPRKRAPIAIGIERASRPASRRWRRRVHAALLTNEFGQVQVKWGRKKPTWPSGRRNGIWVAGRPSGSLFLIRPSRLSFSLSFSLVGYPFLSFSPALSFSHLLRVSLASACDSLLTDGSSCTILTTVHYPRLWFFGRCLGRGEESRRDAAQARCILAM